jgi:hypothetical protein
VAATDVIQLIYEGKLGWVGYEGGGGRYEDLLVDADEVREILRAPKAGAGLTNTEVMAILPGVKHHSLPRLAASGLLRYSSEYRPEIMRTLKVFEKAAVEAFAAKYVALNEVAVTLEFSAVHAMRRLSKAGIVEAVSYERIRSKIYRRSEVSSYLDGANEGAETL